MTAKLGARWAEQRNFAWSDQKREVAYIDERLNDDEDVDDTKNSVKAETQLLESGVALRDLMIAYIVSEARGYDEIELKHPRRQAVDKWLEAPPRNQSVGDIFALEYKLFGGKAVGGGSEKRNVHQRYVIDPEGLESIKYRFLDFFAAMKDVNLGNTWRAEEVDKFLEQKGTVRSFFSFVVSKFYDDSKGVEPTRRRSEQDLKKFLANRYADFYYGIDLIPIEELNATCDATSFEPGVPSITSCNKTLHRVIMQLLAGMCRSGFFYETLIPPIVAVHKIDEFMVFVSARTRGFTLAQLSNAISTFSSVSELRTHVQRLEDVFYQEGLTEWDKLSETLDEINTGETRDNVSIGSESFPIKKLRDARQFETATNEFTSWLEAYKDIARFIEILFKDESKRWGEKNRDHDFVWTSNGRWVRLIGHLMHQILYNLHQLQRRCRIMVNDWRFENIRIHLQPDFDQRVTIITDPKKAPEFQRDSDGFVLPLDIGVTVQIEDMTSSTAIFNMSRFPNKYEDASSSSASDRHADQILRAFARQQQPALFSTFWKLYSDLKDSWKLYVTETKYRHFDPARDITMLMLNLHYNRRWPIYKHPIVTFLNEIEIQAQLHFGTADALIEVLKKRKITQGLISGMTKSGALSVTSKNMEDTDIGFPYPFGLSQTFPEMFLDAVQSVVGGLEQDQRQYSNYIWIRRDIDEDGNVVYKPDIDALNALTDVSEKEDELVRLNLQYGNANSTTIVQLLKGGPQRVKFSRWFLDNPPNKRAWFTTPYRKLDDNPDASLIGKGAQGSVYLAKATISFEDKTNKKKRGSGVGGGKRESENTVVSVKRFGPIFEEADCQCKRILPGILECPHVVTEMIISTYVSMQVYPKGKHSMTFPDARDGFIFPGVHFLKVYNSFVLRADAEEEEEVSPEVRDIIAGYDNLSPSERMEKLKSIEELIIAFLVQMGYRVDEKEKEDKFGDMSAKQRESAEFLISILGVIDVERANVKKLFIGADENGEDDVGDADEKEKDTAVRMLWKGITFVGPIFFKAALSAWVPGGTAVAGVLTGVGEVASASGLTSDSFDLGETIKEKLLNFSAKLTKIDSDRQVFANAFMSMERIDGDLMDFADIVYRLKKACIDKVRDSSGGSGGETGLRSAPMREYVRNALFQTFMALHRFQKDFGGMHNDLHPGNVFIKILDKSAAYYGDGGDGGPIVLADSPYLMYKFDDGRIFRLPNLGFIVKIGDLGNATIDVAYDQAARGKGRTKYPDGTVVQQSRMQTVEETTAIPTLAVRLNRSLNKYIESISAGGLLKKKTEALSLEASQTRKFNPAKDLATLMNILMIHPFFVDSPIMDVYERTETLKRLQQTGDTQSTVLDLPSIKRLPASSLKFLRTSNTSRALPINTEIYLTTPLDMINSSVFFDYDVKRIEGDGKIVDGKVVRTFVYKQRLGTKKKTVKLTSSAVGEEIQHALCFGANDFANECIACGSDPSHEVHFSEDSHLHPVLVCSEACENDFVQCIAESRSMNSSDFERATTSIERPYRPPALQRPPRRRMACGNLTRAQCRLYFRLLVASRDRSRRGLSPRGWRTLRRLERMRRGYYR